MGMKSEKDDPLEGGPPVPRLRDAKSGGGSSDSRIPSSMPKGSPGAASAAASLAGANPVREVTEAMATIEMMVKQMSKHVPAIVQVAQPFIQQMRDVGMAGLANLSQGGTGSVDMGGAGAMPPPGMAGAGGPMAPPAGGPGGGMAGPPIMPMPQF